MVKVKSKNLKIKNVQTINQLQKNDDIVLFDIFVTFIYQFSDI
jgi:hypothetical protein